MPREFMTRAIPLHSRFIHFIIWLGIRMKKSLWLALLLLVLCGLSVYFLTARHPAVKPPVSPVPPLPPKEFAVKDTLPNPAIARQAEQPAQKPRTMPRPAPVPKEKPATPAVAAPDTTPRLYAATPAAQDTNDDFLNQTAASLEKEDTTLQKNEVLKEQIVDPEEKKAVEAWQQQEIQRREEIKEKNWAEYATSLDNKVIGSWKMGKLTRVTFYKDGTGETRSFQEEYKEETLLGNFYFRYTLTGNILKVMPILTQGSRRRITCHFVVKRTNQELVIGPYHYKPE
jgi:hypothetical protein